MLYFRTAIGTRSNSRNPNEFPTPPLYGCPNIETAPRNVVPFCLSPLVPRGERECSFRCGLPRVADVRKMSEGVRTSWPWAIDMSLLRSFQLGSLRSHEDGRERSGTESFIGKNVNFMAWPSRCRSG